MNLPLLPLSIVALGCLGAAASVWSDRAADDGARPQRTSVDGADLESRWPAGWHHSLDAARSAANAGEPAEWTRILVYARMDTPECVELEARLGADPLVAERMRAMVPLVVDVGLGRGALADALELDAAPLFVVLHSEGVVVDALEPLTGSRFEPFGFAEELARAASGEGDIDALGRALSYSPDAVAYLAYVDRLEARGAYRQADSTFRAALRYERRPNGLLHRADRLRSAIRAQRPSGGGDGAPDGASAPPADREGAIEAQLAVEDDSAMLYRGWSYLASVFADHVERAERSGTGSYRGVPRERWHRRLRDATRRAWRGAPDRAMLAYGALIATRYAGEVEDLDSADRMFCKAVLRSITRAAGEESVRVQAAIAAVESMKRRD